jgi:ketosteroid isomerase-like protein
MSESNVDAVRALFEAWNAGEELDAWFCRFDPDIVYHPRADEPDPSPHVGRDALERLIRAFADAFSEVVFDVLEVIDVGDRVITSTVVHARLRDSEAEVSDGYVFVHDVRDGVIVEGWEYRTKEEALASVSAAEPSE